MVAEPPHAPDRSVEQRLDALERANEVRSARAQLKRDLKSGKISARELLLHPPEFLESMKVIDLVRSMPAFGRVKADRTLVQCRISPSKTIGGLSVRQRTELASLVGRRAREVHHSSRPGHQAQCMEALQRANKVRLSRAELKSKIRSGEFSVTQVMENYPPEAKDMEIGDLLASQKRWGNTRVDRLLSKVPVSPTKLIGNMTDRQRRAIARLLTEPERVEPKIMLPNEAPAEPAPSPVPDLMQVLTSAQVASQPLRVLPGVPQREDKPERPPTRATFHRGLASRIA